MGGPCPREAALLITGALSNLITTLGHDILLNFPKIVKENAWCLKSGGEETFARIAKSCGYIKILHISAYVIIFVCVFSICPLSEHDKIWQGALSLIDEYISNSSKPLFTILYYISFTSSVYSFIHHILNHYVISLVKMSMQNSDKVGYQEEIYRQIIILVRIKERTRKFCNMMLVYADYAAIPLTFIAIELLVCVAAFIIFEVRPESNIRLSLSFAPVVIFAVNLCSNGQRAKDESENVYNNALKCGWYNWNTRNRRAYLMFLISNMKPVRFSRSGVYDVDYPLFVFVSITTDLSTYVNDMENWLHLVHSFHQYEWKEKEVLGEARRD
ncbi:unnamed protein product [Phaedon cochleariae]|uniref:Odorant receptor n=1 Tax=Phaedon cochleariae TaxID=80249 RepID=A0A9N9SNL8_PHACE|nr:unnamed protein product [Phaedon cochleariae]